MSPACRRPGAFRRRRISGRRKTRCRFRGSRTPAASSSARPTCRSGSATGRATTTIYGTTNNPYDLGRTPGGSSGGSSAALAAGYGPLSIGSDIGGSLRVPAFHCGVYAHKPTYDLVPLRGHTPPPLPPLPFDRDLAVIGPMARSAADLSLLLDVIAGPDPLDAGIAYRLALPPSRHTRVQGFSRAGDRHRSAAADRQGRARRDRTSSPAISPRPASRSTARARCCRISPHPRGSTCGC